MKKFALLAVLAGGMLLTVGCDTPGYTARERFGRITRNWGFEYEQSNDDWDSILLLRPADHLTYWNVQ